MRHFIHQLVIGSLAGALVAGCGAAQTPAMVKGQVNQSSFPQALTHLTVVSSTGARTQIPVAADGTFQAKLAPGAAYRLDFAGSGSSTGSVVFPRSGGSINSAFAMVGPTTLDLGKLTYIGDPKAHTYAFTQSGTAGGTTDSQGDVEVDDSNTCSTDDGASSDTGSGDATDGGSGDTGSASGDTGGTSGDTAGSGDSADGPDMTGAEAQQETDKIDQEPAEAAVPEHNAPSEAGCGSSSGSSGSNGTPIP